MAEQVSVPQMLGRIEGKVDALRETMRGFAQGQVRCQTEVFARLSKLEQGRAANSARFEERWGWVHTLASLGWKFALAAAGIAYAVIRIARECY